MFQIEEYLALKIREGGILDNYRKNRQSSTDENEI